VPGGCESSFGHDYLRVSGDRWTDMSTAQESFLAKLSPKSRPNRLGSSEEWQIDNVVVFRLYPGCLGVVTVPLDATTCGYRVTGGPI
jgi:hypothetical protein